MVELDNSLNVTEQGVKVFKINKIFHYSLCFLIVWSRLIFEGVEYFLTN